jgi:hypothetical protein
MDLDLAGYVLGCPELDMGWSGHGQGWPHHAWTVLTMDWAGQLAIGWPGHKLGCKWFGVYMGSAGHELGFPWSGLDMDRTASGLGCPWAS